MNPSEELFLDLHLQVQFKVDGKNGYVYAHCAVEYDRALWALKEAKG